MLLLQCRNENIRRNAVQDEEEIAFAGEPIPHQSDANVPSHLLQRDWLGHDGIRSNTQEPVEAHVALPLIGARIGVDVGHHPDEHRSGGDDLRRG